MNDMTPDKIKDLLESAIKSNTSAWVAQSKYFDDLVTQRGLFRSADRLSRREPQEDQRIQDV